MCDLLLWARCGDRMGGFGLVLEGCWFRSGLRLWEDRGWSSELDSRMGRSWQMFDEDSTIEIDLLEGFGLWRRGGRRCVVRRVGSKRERGLWFRLVFERAWELGMEIDNGEPFAEVRGKLEKRVCCVCGQGWPVIERWRTATNRGGRFAEGRLLFGDGSDRS